MAFGIGINTQKADAGRLRGNKKEIACQCWFTSSGKITPLMIKLQDETGEIRTIRQIQVLSQEEKMYAGVPSVEFNCKVTIQEQRFDVRLVYYKEENRWILVFR